MRYVESGDIEAFADEVEQLLDDPALRVRMGKEARRRVSEQFDWRGQAKVYHGVFDELSGRPVDAQTGTAPTLTDADDWGRRYVPLDDDAEFGRYIRERRA